MKNALGSLLVTATVLGTVGGCVVEARGHVAPPRAVVVERRPGYVFVQGHWVREGGRWVWFEGHWELERRGYVWFPGHWERRGNRHFWIEGEWRASGPVVRDHR